MEKKKVSKKRNSSIKNLKKLSLLITIVPRGKKEIVISLLERFKVNFQFSLHGRGTFSSFSKNNRDIIFSVIRDENVKDAILNLEDEFEYFGSNESSSFAIPLNSLIGVSNYLFLSKIGGKKNGSK